MVEGGVVASLSLLRFILHRCHLAINRINTTLCVRLKWFVIVIWLSICLAGLIRLEDAGAIMYLGGSLG